MKRPVKQPARKKNSAYSKGKKGFAKLFDAIAVKITRITGSATAFIVAFTVIIVWAISGPLFNFSDTWQLVINTGTTIVTFLMVFIIQQSQNKDTLAIQLKLNELIACNDKASNRLIDIEDLTDEELRVLKKFYIQLSDMAEEEADLYATHSLDEAEHNHVQKKTLKKHPKTTQK